MGIRRVVKKYNINNQPNDYSYWQSKTYQERLAALEQIRSEYNSWRYLADQRLQRVYLIIKQT